MRKRLFPIAAAIAVLSPVFVSCLDENDKVAKDYSEWRKENNAFFQECLDKTDADGQPYYERLSPAWAPGMTILVKRHNAATPDAMRPMDNSLCAVKYQGRLYTDSVFDSSFNRTDSIYTCRPMDNITGFWAVLTTMAEGDSVTAIIPSTAAYGASSSGAISPYSTLIFELKLKKILSWDSPMDD